MAKRIVNDAEVQKEILEKFSAILGSCELSFESIATFSVLRLTGIDSDGFVYAVNFDAFQLVGAFENDYFDKYLERHLGMLKRRIEKDRYKNIQVSLNMRLDGYLAIMDANLNHRLRRFERNLETQMVQLRSGQSIDEFLDELILEVEKL